MYLLRIFPILSFIVSNKVTADENGDEKVVSLCENPRIHSADHLQNDTIRLYRDYHYWELIGIPNRTCTVEGPHRVWWPNHPKVTIETSTHTSLTGPTRGVHYVYYRNRYWDWLDDGKQREGGVEGSVWPGLPAEGFHAVYHDGNLSRTGRPMIVGMRGIKVWYMHFDDFVNVVGASGNISAVGTKFDENFPSDITSAFMWYSNDTKVEYNVYLFRDQKYCLRGWKPGKSGKDCDEWRENRELFGCQESNPGPQPSDKPDIPPNDIPDPGVVLEQTTEKNSGFNGLGLCSVLLLVTIFAKTIF